MILVDTGALYAVFVQSDQNHPAAVAWLKDNSTRLVITNFIVAETLTLLRARGHVAQARSLSRRLATTDFALVEWITRSDFERAWRVFDEFSDKHWSFTDCTSYAVIGRMGIARAFAFDDHFRQFGTVTIVP